ncbi:holdfast anchoring protein HfaA [Brevundimonas naejangsanensis]|uniref:holdfast anchoring protein HfaA n=1 Tax=Brevundimonas naejangsanensis TaxID=588932 RepID=UPI0013C4FC01|nr:holdfast anchoring protein HfaA [Brevundimonas naejangsanensis]
MSSHTLTLIAVTAAGALAAADASAQAAGSAGAGQFQAGYGASRYTTARPSQGTTRDANGNRLVVNGIIQSGASSYSSTSSGVSSSGSINGSGNGSGTNISGATAIGNNLNVVVQGNRNTVVVNSTQNNTGNITAGTALNGTLVFP